MGFSRQKFLNQTLLNCHDKTKAFYGELGGFPMVAAQNAQNKQLVVSVFAKAPEELGNFAETNIQQWAQQQSGISSADYEFNRLTITFSVARANPEEYIAQLLHALTEWLKSRGFTPCCNGCGADVYANYYLIEDIGAYYCSGCASSAESTLEDRKIEISSNRVKPLGILAGALAGGLTMFILTFLLWKINIIAPAAGLVAAVVLYACVKSWGGRLPIWGVVVCLGIMLGATIFSLRFAVASDLHQTIGELKAETDISREELDVAKGYLAMYTDDEIFEMTGGQTRAELMDGIEVNEQALEIIEGHDTTMDCYKDLSKLLDIELLSDWKRDYHKGLLYMLLVGMNFSILLMSAAYKESNGHYKMICLG